MRTVSQKTRAKRKYAGMLILCGALCAGIIMLGPELSADA